MKPIQFLALIIITLLSCNSSKLISERTLKKKNYLEVKGIVKEGETKPDRYAMYPNGAKGVESHIQRKTNYPWSAIEYGIQGKVIVQFNVNTLGKVDHIVLVDSLTADLNNVAKRVILDLDQFYPAIKDGKPVHSQYIQPIQFSLN